MNSIYVVFLHGKPHSSHIDLAAAKWVVKNLEEFCQGGQQPSPRGVIYEFELCQDAESFYWHATYKYVFYINSYNLWRRRPTKGIKYRPQFDITLSA